MTASVALPAGYRLIALETIDSTSAEARRRIAAGEQAGAVIWSRRQTAGRGRRGRHWQSPSGNLYLTLIAAAPVGGLAGQIAFLAALAAGDAVRAVLPEGRDLVYKWPNDLLLDEGKLAGILIEGASGPDGLPLLAIGIGINVATAPEGAASLHMAGARITVEQLLGAVCSAFDRWQAILTERGFAPLRAAWLAHASGLGEPIEVRFPDGGVAPGVFRDIDERGALLLLEPGGATRRIAAGEVFFAAA